MGIDSYCKRFFALRFALGLVVAALASPFAATASEITGISLSKSPQGEVLSIRSDSELDYQSFDLNAPPRLVLTFPNSHFAKDVKAVAGTGGGIESLSTTVTKSGARIDIAMSSALTYKVEQKEHLLVLHFSTVTASKAADKKQKAVLKDIAVTDKGGMTELEVRGEHMNASHDAFVTNNGRTLILDFWGATSVLPKEHYAESTQKVSSVNVGEAKGRVRLVVNLVPGVSDKHQIDVSANRMLVRFGSVNPSRKAAQVQVEDVKFRPKDRIAQMVVRTNVSNPVVSMHEEKGNAILDIKKAALVKGQQRSQDVSEFPGPLSRIDSYRVGDKVRIVAKLREKVEISSFQQGNLLTVTFVPKDIAQAKRGASKGEKLTYTGQKVSFDYQGIDIRNALRLIAEMSDMNIIMSDDVQGKLTMRLENVPWDQALDIILESQGLGKEVQGNVMRIAPLAVLNKERKASLEAQQNEAELAPLVTEFITLNFAKADDVKKMLESVKSSSGASGSSKSGGASGSSSGGATGNGSGASGSGMLTPRGSFVVDERTNTLIVKDTQESIDNIKRMIAKIDKPVKQVLIEARIVEATDNFTRDLGVAWGGQVSGNGGKVTNQVSNSTTTPGGFLVDLPAATAATNGGTIGLAVGAVSSAFNLNLELSAAEADDKIKIVSNPRVVTTNLQTASINQGSEIPFQSSSANGGTNVQFKKANLGLEVTPQITADNRIMLHVKATKDAPSTTATVAGNPVIDTKQIETEIFMNNGETIVIGGIYTRNKTGNMNGIPLLSRIPLLGWLFKKTTKTDNKTELLIFITPTIIQSGAPNNSEVAQGT